MDSDLPLSLDDFIPPHLQKKQNRGASQTNNAHTDSPGEGDLIYKATLVLTDESRDSPIPRKEKRWIRYEGIGPTDEHGMPFASRSSVDSPREWYKNMYRVLHQMSDSEDSDGDDYQSKPEGNHEDDFTLSHQSKFLTNQSNGQSKLDEHSKRTSQEPSRLQITMKSNIRESPIQASSTLKVGRSPDPTKSRASTLPRSSPCQTSQKSPHYSSKVSYSINSANTMPSSQNYNTQRSHQVLSSTSNKQQSSVPALLHFFPDHSSHSSQSNKGAAILESLNQKPKNSPSSTTSNTHILSPTFREPSRLTSEVLEQLEIDLRNFTEELDRDLEARKQHPETTLEQCEEVLLRSHSGAGGSPKTKVNKSRRQGVEEQQAYSPVSQAAVKFDFVAESEKEISLQRGTTVNILKKVDEHWLLGEQDGRRGLFPESYVRVLIPGLQELLDAPQLSGVALYDFKADSDAELPLRKGQRVLINRRVGGNWFEGRAEGSSRLGLFPASYVQVTDGLVQARKVDTIIKLAKDTNTIEQVSSALLLQEGPRTVKAPESSRRQELQGTLYRVLFNYSPKNTDELQLITGDMVTVTQQCDDGWYVGVCWRTQKFGTFPGNFVVPCESS